MRSTSSGMTTPIRSCPAGSRSASVTGSANYLKVSLAFPQNKKLDKHQSALGIFVSKRRSSNLTSVFFKKNTFPLVFFTWEYYILVMMCSLGASLPKAEEKSFFFDKKNYLDYRCLGMCAIFIEIDWRPDENQYQADLKRNTGFLHCINFKCLWGNRNAG